MLDSQDRLHILLRTNRLLAADLSAPVLLQQILDAAATLVSAGWAVLQVLDLDGACVNFLHTALPHPAPPPADPDLTEGQDRAGTSWDPTRTPPACTGTDHDQPCPLPDGHPPLDTMLNLAIGLGGEHLGTLHIFRTARTPFTAEERDLTEALAGIAAVAIRNNRLHRTNENQAGWMHASAMVTCGTLTAPTVPPLHLVLDQAAFAAAADLVAVLIPTPSQDNLRVELALGTGAEWIQDLQIPIEGTQSGAAFRSGEPVNSEEVASFEPVLARRAHLGPTMIAPMPGTGGMLGLLVLARTSEQPPFSAQDLELAQRFAGHTAVCVELAEVRAEEKTHRHTYRAPQSPGTAHGPTLQIIQDLFAAALDLQYVCGLLDPGKLTDRLCGAIAKIDKAILATRTMPTAEVSDPAHPGDRIGEQVAGRPRRLGSDPGLRIDLPGPPPPLEDLVEDLLTTLRETLSDKRRHAAARAAFILLRGPEGRLTLQVHDNGRDTVLAWSIPWTGTAPPRVTGQTRRPGATPPPRSGQTRAVATPTPNATTTTENPQAWRTAGNGSGHAPEGTPGN